MDLQQRVEEQKRQVFLRRVCELCGQNPGATLASGKLGQELGLPYEQTLEIVEELQRRGWLHRLEELMPPDGPMVHLTRAGIRAAKERAA